MVIQNFKYEFSSLKLKSIVIPIKVQLYSCHKYNFTYMTIKNYNSQRYHSLVHPSFLVIFENYS